MLKNTVIHGRMIHSSLYPSSDAVPQGSHQYARYASGAGSHVCCAGAPPVVVVLHNCSRRLPFRVTAVSILSQHQLWPHQLQAGTPSDEDRSCTEPREVASGTSPEDEVAAENDPGVNVPEAVLVDIPDAANSHLQESVRVMELFTVLGVRSRRGRLFSAMLSQCFLLLKRS